MLNQHRSHQPISSEISVLLEEWLHVLHVHSVVHVGVEFECRCLQLLVSKSATIEELGVLLVVVAETGDFTAFPGKVTQEVGTMHTA